MERLTQLILLPLASLILPASALAIELSAFGSLAVGRINSKENVRLIDYEDDWSTTSETMLGVQLTHRISRDFEFTTQVLAEGFSYQAREEYDPRFDWVFLSYRPSHAYRARIGRIRTPLFFYSDSLHVGYSYPWVRPPIDVYYPRISTLANIDGFDITFNHQMSESDLEASAFLGQGDARNNNITVTADIAVGATISWFNYNTTWRFSMAAVKGDAQERVLTSLGNAFEQMVNIFGAPSIFQQIADAHNLEGRWLYYYSFGVVHNVGDWAIRTELNYQDESSEGLATSYKGIFASVSRTFGRLSPFAAAGFGEIQVNNYLQDLIYESQRILPEGISIPIDSLRQIALAGYEDINTKGWSATLGCRYDFHPKIALKVEAQYFDTIQHPAFRTRAVVPKAEPSVLATTITLDFVL